MRRLLSLLTALGFVLPLLAAPAGAQPSQTLYSQLQWRNIGPLRGGRAITVTGVSGQPNTFYFGAVGGGIWKTENTGRTWTPIFDAQRVASIGAIAVAPSDPNVIYAGSGEADMRSDIQHGDGMYKSTDAGKTWTHTGLEDTRQIGRIVVDPKDANVVYVAALGHQYGPNAQRGIFKSTDGGRTWSKILFRDDNTGAIDIAIDQTNPNVIFASLWQTRRPPWNVYPPSNGPGSGLYKSIDAGKTWTHVTGGGFPGGTLGHIGIAISPADHNRIYAMVDTNDSKTGGVYRSDDGGAAWTHTDNEQRIWMRGWYFGQITADPKNADTVYVMNTSTYRSTDAGKSFDVIRGAPGGDDYHALWVDPSDANRMILGGDQGVNITVDGAKTWSSWYNQSTAQLYHVITDKRFPYWVYGAQQDSGAVAVPSRSVHAGITARDWKPIDAGGESGTIAPDPLHPGVEYGSGAVAENIDTNWELSIDPTMKYPDNVWRNTWTLPIVVSPQNPRVLYTSHQQIFRTSDGGNSWHIISPDLTRKTNTVPPTLDPPTVADSTGLARRGVVYWLAPSPVQNREIWAGTDDGLIWITRDEGAHWQNVTPAALTPWSKVAIIDASHFDAQTAYAAIDRHRLDDNRPYIYKTHDGGKHWSLVTNGIPSDESVNVVREDPKRRGLLYAGTERAVYVSFDDGAQWQSLQQNLPAASIRDIVFNGDDVVLATHGRGIWILDDAAALREVSSAASSAAYLFTPAIAYRTRPGNDQGTPIPPDETVLDNPPNGAIVDYYVGSGAAGTLTLQIRDAAGQVVRQWSSTDKPVIPNPKQLTVLPSWVPASYPPSSKPGAHRWVWDFHYAGAGTSRRRRGGTGPLAPPARYTVVMQYGGKTYTRSLDLRRDPTAQATNADLRKQFELAQAIEAESEQVKAALARATSLVKAHPQLRSIVGEAPPTTPDDSVGKPAQDFHSLRYIGDALQALEGAVESADARPTSDMYAAFSVLQSKTAAALRTLQTVSH